MLSFTSRKRFSKIYKNYIGGKWVESKGTQHFDIINPATQELVAKVP
jgi:acyl-CoA reductase-like NAD-dependent aldehyde dehydrogenase